MSTIERGYNLPTDNFTLVPNLWIRDARLSRRARGLLVELMSHRAGWRTSVASLADRGPEGEAALKTAVKELEKAGYLERAFETDERGRRTGIRYIIVDPALKENASSDPSGENRLMDDEPSGENRPTDSDETAGHPSGDFPPVGNHPPKKNTLQEEHSSRALQEEKNRCRVVDETHHRASDTNDAAAAAEFDAIKSEVDEKRTAVEQTLVAMNIDLLLAACRNAGLTASFHKLTDEQRAEISELVQQHDVSALVKSAQRQHRPDSPARFVQAWLPEWRSLTTTRSSGSTARPTSGISACDRCDEFGWIIDYENGNDVRCNHTRTAGAA